MYPLNWVLSIMYTRLSRVLHMMGAHGAVAYLQARPLLLPALNHIRMAGCCSVLPPTLNGNDKVLERDLCIHGARACAIIARRRLHQRSSWGGSLLI